jgi:hypothetical protein
MTAAGGKRECANCFGDGRRARMLGDRCPSCNAWRSVDDVCGTCSGTGYVWPSVEGEVVISANNDGASGSILGLLSDVSLACIDRGHYRIIVQPIPAAQKEQI